LNRIKFFIYLGGAADILDAAISLRGGNNNGGCLSLGDDECKRFDDEPGKKRLACDGLDDLRVA
jgi:hypothetical protein